MPTIYKLKFEKVLDITENDASFIEEIAEKIESENSPELIIFDSILKENAKQAEDNLPSDVLIAIKDLTKKHQTFVILE